MSNETRGIGSLGPGFARGAVYLGAAHWLTLAINFGLNLAIARVLGPDAFGPYALAYALNELLVIFGAFSIQLVLLQSRAESQSLYDTAAAISAALGLAALVASLGLAAFAAVRDSAEVAWFVVVLGGARFMNLLMLVPWAKMERSLRYGALAGAQMVSSSVPNVCALALALSGVGAWSLVIRDLLLAASSLVLVTLLSGYRFRLRVERAAARYLVELARPLFAAQGSDALLERIDRLALATAFSPRVVGLYHQARQLALAGVQAARPVLQLSFNLYARTQDDRDRLARAHYLVDYCLARGSAAVATIWLVFPAEAVRLLLGETWLPASPILRWLAIYAALLPIAMSSKQLLMARGEGFLTVRVRLAQAIVFLLGVGAAAAAGSLAGVVAAITAATAVGCGLANHYNARVVETHLNRTLFAPSIACIATWGVFELLARGGLVAALPWPCRPFLPPVLFALLLLAIERRTLLREIAFLRDALRRSRDQVGSAAGASGL